MGKPFKSELSKLSSTQDWAENLDLDKLQKDISKIDSPVYFVGSGGSLSACFYGASLMEERGVFAEALTPLELYSKKNIISKAFIIFISASGKNSDILFAFKTAIKFEAKQIISICMQSESKLAALSNKYTISKIHEFELPVGKDGFLATNSLVSYFIILKRLFGHKKGNKSNKINLDDTTNFYKALKPFTSITVLYNGWSKSVAYDIESKSVEAALYPILLSDYRNFGHGRHHWFAKKSDSAAIIALSTPEDNFLAEKTLNALPDSVPKLLLHTKKRGALGTVELLIKSFYLIDNFGDNLGIDPGRPGVPEFGRKLYNLKYATALIKTELSLNLSLRAKSAIARKCKKTLSSLNDKELKAWGKSYSAFIQQLNNADYGAVVFDYDGTLCSAERKYIGPDKSMSLKLIEILENGFYMGVVTGRGKSVRIDLQKIIPKRHWNKVIIGYYNGSEIALLSENEEPNITKETHISLRKLMPILKKHEDLKIDCTLRPNQLTIETTDDNNFLNIKENVLRIIKSSDHFNVQVLESSHSMDIIPVNISKTDILNPIKSLLEKNGLSTDLLCIGDRGKFPGNDYRLLDTPYSLSVYEVNNNKKTCWNLASLGVTHTDATLQYLNWLKFESSKMKLKIAK
jgi:hydroxymethylpyrimidine pyrophosphatase-like HAD family hydrolase